MLFHRELSDNQNVCTSCGHHMSITRVNGLRRCSMAAFLPKSLCPRHWQTRCISRDQKKYPERMKAAQKSTGERDAMLVASGEIGRTPIVAAAQDFSSWVL